MSAERRSGDAQEDAVAAARARLAEAREALAAAERALGRVESRGERKAPEPFPDPPETAAWTWRAKLWACPAETRIGVAELVEALDCSESWIYARTKADAEDPIPHRKIGGSLRFLAGEVRHWLREREKAPVQGPSWSPAEGGLGIVEGGTR